MGIYYIVPGADFSAAPGKLGQVTFPTIDPLPVFGMSGLQTWFSAVDYAGSGASGTWADRIKNVVGTPRQPTVPPASGTTDGQPSVSFTTAGLGLPGTLLSTSSYHWMFVAKPSLAGTRGLLGAGTSGTAIGPRIELATNGSITAANNGAVSSNASTVGVVTTGVTQIIEASWDSTNGFVFSVNGAAAGASAQATVPVVPSAGMVIGASFADVSRGFNGPIFEVLQFTRNMRLASADLANLQYLRRRFATQYGITLP